MTTFFDLLAESERRLQLLKAAGALLFFFVSLIVIFTLSYLGKLTNEQTFRLLLACILSMAAVLGVAVDWKKLSFSPVAPAPQTENAGIGPGAFGFVLTRKQVTHIYEANGDFHGKWRYRVNNATTIRLCDLPPDKAGWFGKDFGTKASVRSVGDTDGFRTITLPEVRKQFSDARYVNGAVQAVTYLSWQPTVPNGVGPGEEVEYEVSIDTVGTELQAFTKDGSFAGMGTDFVTDEISCEVRSPSGYRFLNRGFELHDRTGAVVQQAELSKPVFENDDTLITWRVENPIPTVLYLLKIVIEKQA